jgi:hypothetical protein
MSTTPIHGNEAVPASDLDDEALALAERVTRKIRTPTSSPVLPAAADDYEPQALEHKPKR